MSTLRPAAEARLVTLRAELATGQDALAQLDTRRTALSEMLLRIAGAVQVLEEILATPEPADPSAHGAAPEETTPCPNLNAEERTSSRSP